MRPDELPLAMGHTCANEPHWPSEAVLEHFESKYPTIDYHGRRVFRFTNERSFGDGKHAISLHAGPTGATPEHIYQYVLLTYCYQGSFPMVLDGRQVTLRQGDCLVADRHCPHAVEEVGAGSVGVNIVLNDRFFEKRMLADLSRLRTTFGTELVTPAADHTHWRVYHADDALCLACIEQILCEHLDPAIGSADIIDDLCAALMTQLLRNNEKDVASAADAEKNSLLIGRVHEYVARSYREGRLTALADELGYDSAYLSAHIRKATARTFKQLVNEERMRQATILLQGSELPAYKIAQEVGISNLTQFYQRFREFAGMTPQEYRDTLKRG